ncbi:MAG: hypothetical protein IPK13_01955 [Deltaproteobacteria bacterium]|nr:hypothetical protein [Deltaproteobacteria bacterium]
MGLGAGVWVKTADESSAELQLARGGMLYVSAGSMVVIEAPDESDEDGQVAAGQISVLRGRIRARVESNASRQKLLVRNQHGRRLRVSPSSPKAGVSYELSADGQGVVALSVTTGQAHVVSDEGRSLDVASGETRAILDGAGPSRDAPSGMAGGGEPSVDPSVDPSGDLDVGQRGDAALEAPTVENRLLLPRDGAVVGFSGASPTLSFAWKPVDRSSVERVREPRFRSGGEPDGELGAKKRSESVSDSASDSDSDAEYEYEYELVIARDETLQDVVHVLTTKALRARTRAVGPGQYYWGYLRSMPVGVRRCSRTDTA